MKLLEWPEDIEVTHIDKPYYAACDRYWRVDVNRTSRLYCGRTYAEAWQNWHAFMQRIGKPRPNPKKKSNHWSWNSREQKWEFSFRQKLSRHLKRDQSRLKTLHENMENERQRIRKRSLSAKIRANALVERTEKRLRERRRELQKAYKNRPTYSKVVRGFHLSGLSDAELKQIVFRQAIGPMQYHEPSKSWFCKIGKHQPKLIKLGESEEAARRMWLILKHGLRGATDVLVSVARHAHESNSAPCPEV